MNWIELFAATVSASLIGSIHCVGMCGPFVIMATHRRSESESSSYSKIVGYHLGRLTTYFLLGTLAGFAGTLVNGAGQTIGWSHSAARIVGISMVILGISRLIHLNFSSSQTVSHSKLLQYWTKSILAIGKLFQPASPARRAYIIGLITTWLPCGWLYLFALAACSAGSVAGANALMLAFWIGTLPLLSLVSIGEARLFREARLSQKAGLLNRASSRGLLPLISLQSLTAVLMIAFGGYTFFHRSRIELDLLVANHRNGILTKANIDAMAHQPLPCCTHAVQVANDAETVDEP